MLEEIPNTWKQGRRDDAARNELVRTLREVSELDAGRAVIDLLKHGVSADSIWEGLFATAAELVLRRPTVVPVHAQTSANALHYVFRHARAETTQLLALLQSAAFMPAFRRRVRKRAIRSAHRRAGASPGLRRRRRSVCAMHSPSCRTIAPPALARHCTSCSTAAPQKNSSRARAGTWLATGRRSHDYKFTEAALENHGEMAPTAWRDRILSASMAYFIGSESAPSPVARRALRLLGQRQPGFPGH